MNTTLRKFAVASGLGLLLCSGFLLGIARTTAGAGPLPPSALVSSPAASSVSIVLSALQGLGAQGGAASQPTPQGADPTELLAWQKMQNHLQRVECLWASPYAPTPGGELAPDPQAPPRYVVVRTFDSPFGHAPSVAPTIAHAGLRILDPATFQSRIVLLESIAPNTFLAELHDSGQYLGWGLWVEALAWEPGADPTDPVQAFYRSPFIEL